jgi:hypothetical protein
MGVPATVTPFGTPNVQNEPGWTTAGTFGGLVVGETGLVTNVVGGTFAMVLTRWQVELPMLGEPSVQESLMQESLMQESLVLSQKEQSLPGKPMKVSLAVV